MYKVLAKVIQFSQGVRSWPIVKRQPVLWLGLVLVALIVGFVIALQPAHANVVSFTTVGNGLIWAFSQLFLAIARLMMSITVFFLQLFIQLAAYNNFIDAPPVVIGWLMVRDVANMFFVVALLVIAFGTILGLEQYEWKKTLMKLILAAIFINFSKMILQLVIDVAHVFTTTFLNAIVATAGGNLIAMFHLDKVLQMTPKDLTFGNAGEDLRLDLAIGALMALIFSIMATVIIGAYLVVMLMRMVVLWVLIILSPLAFIAQVLPNTKSYAEEYWKEFMHHVIVAPVMVFFLWLTFATLGSGDISSVVAPNLVPEDAIALASQSDLPLSSTISLSEASTWENFASFLIALGFLFVGLDRVQKLGVKGGGIVSGAVNFGKKVAAIATGYAAGRYLYEGAAGLGKKGIKDLAYHAPILGGKRWEQRWQTQLAAWSGALSTKGTELTDKGERIRVQAEAKQTALGVAKGELPAEVLHERIEQLKTDKESFEQKRDKAVEGGDTRTAEEAERHIKTIEDDIQAYQEAEHTLPGLRQDAGARKALQEEVERLEKETSKHLAAPFLGRIVRSGIMTEKRMEKTKKDAETRKKLLWKRVGSEAGGYIGGIGTKGILGTGFLGDKYGNKKLFEAMDRVYRGQLQGEEMRSAAKDKEFETKGKLEVLGRSRLKFDVDKNELKYEVSAGSMQQRIFQHELLGEHAQNGIQGLDKEARLKVMAEYDKNMQNKQELEGRVGALKKQLDETQDPTQQQRIAGEIQQNEAALAQVTEGAVRKGAISYGDFLRRKASTQKLSEIFDSADKSLFEAQITDDYNAGKLVDVLARRYHGGEFDDQTKSINTDLEQVEKDISNLRGREFGSLDADLKNKTEEISRVNNNLGVLETDKRLESALGQLDPIMRQQSDAVIRETDPKKKAALQKELDRLTEQRQRFSSERVEIQPERDTILGGLDIDAVILQMKANLKTKEDERTTLEKTIRSKEEELKTSNTQTGIDFSNLKKKRTNLRVELENARERLGIRANDLRNGDDTVVDDMVAKVDQKIAQTPVTDTATIKQLQKEKSALEQMRLRVHRGSLAWTYGVAKGKQADVARGHKYAHNLLLSEAEQRAVFDSRGLDVPKTTLTELIEEYGKSFNEMGIESFVANAGSMLVKMLDKKKAGTLTEQDRAALMGLFKRGFDKSWIDDAIYAIMDNEKAKEAIGDELGWKDVKYTDDKVRAIQMLFATGADVDFVRQNSVVTNIMDVAENDPNIKMSTKAFLDGAQTGKFTDKNGKDVTLYIMKTVRQQMKERGESFSEKQEEMFAKFFAGLNSTEIGSMDADVDGKWVDTFKQKVTQVKATADPERKQIMNSWLETARERQSEFQFLGNLRSEALKNGHLENAGWALGREVGVGESIYIPMGVNSARGHAMGDARKMLIRDRVSMQSHSFALLDERNNQVLTDLLENQFASLMSGLSPREFGSINPRAKLHIVGLSAANQPRQFIDRQGFFHMSALRSADGSLSDAANTWQEEISRDEKLGDVWRKASTDAQRQELMAAQQMQRVFAKAMRGNMTTFVMSLAEAAGRNPSDSALTGEIQVKIFNPRTKKEEEYTNIKTLIRDYNSGDWNINTDSAGNIVCEKIAEALRINDFVPAKGDKDVLQNILDVGTA